MNSLRDFQVRIHSLRVSSVDGGPIRQSQAKRYNSLEIITKLRNCQDSWNLKILIPQKPRILAVFFWDDLHKLKDPILPNPASEHHGRRRPELISEYPFKLKG